MVKQDGFVLESGMSRFSIRDARDGDGVCGEVEVLSVDSDWLQVAEFSVSLDTEVLDPFDEDNCPSAATRARYYRNPDSLSKVKVNAIGISANGVAYNVAETGRTVGEVVMPVVRTMVRAISRTLDRAEKRCEVVIEDECDFTIHASMVAELTRFLSANFKTDVQVRRTAKNATIEFDLN